MEVQEEQRRGGSTRTTEREERLLVPWSHRMLTLGWKRERLSQGQEPVLQEVSQAAAVRTVLHGDLWEEPPEEIGEDLEWVVTPEQEMEERERSAREAWESKPQNVGMAWEGLPDPEWERVWKWGRKSEEEMVHEASTGCCQIGERRGRGGTGSKKAKCLSAQFVNNPK